MPVDPAIAALLPMFDAAPKLSEGTPQEGRDALRTLLVELRDPAAVTQVADVSDAQIAGVPVRVYRPDAAAPLPTIVYLHGGGFVIGDLDTHDGVCRALARDSDAVVISVDYRLAPEHPFPAAVDDSWAVLQAVAADIASYGGDAGRLAVGGDSAGGNLAAVCAQLARDAGLDLALQLLVYPTVDMGGDYPSREENGEGYFLTTADMIYFAGHYLGITETDPAAADRLGDPRVSPLLADSLAGLAPAIVVTAQFDPLRDEGNAYAAALEQAGVQVRHRQFDGLIHGFFGMEQFSAAVAEASRWIDEQVRDVLHPAS